MDTRDGSIHEITPEKIVALGDLFKEHFVPVDMNFATTKQRTKGRVSLKDHRSTLGEQLTRERAKRGMTKNAMRRLRRQGKLK